MFVVGLPRSGTTLTEQILASHSRIHGAGELRLARRSFESLPAIVGQPGPPRDRVSHLDEVAVQRIAADHLGLLDAIDGGHAARIVDKMPDNYMYLGFLTVLFPQAVFIHCRRDLRDVAVSCWINDFRSLRWANHPDHIAGRCRNYCRLMLHWREVLPAPAAAPVPERRETGRSFEVCEFCCRLCRGTALRWVRTPPGQAKWPIFRVDAP